MENFMNTAKIRIDMIKAPDLWHNLKDKLNLDDDIFYRYIEYGDYGEIEIEVDEKLNIISGKFIPCCKDS